MNVCVITTGHKFSDNRINYKEVQSMAEAGVNVTFVGYGDDVPNDNDNIHYVKLTKKGSGRITRWISAFFCFTNIKQIDADIYHIHDPELLFCAARLKRTGKNVLYDAHEDFPRQILSKEYLLRTIRKLLSVIFEKIENKVVSKLDGVVAATPKIAKRFSQINNNTIGAYNYPSLHEYSNRVTNKDRYYYCYIGLITRVRGIKEVVLSTKYTSSKLIICGEFESPALFNEISSLPEWKNVLYKGQLSRSDLNKVLSTCAVGVVTFYPEPNHLEAMPNKLYEYMACNMAVVASDFMQWVQLIQDRGAGICVNPYSAQDIGNAVEELLKDYKWVEMGERGRLAIEGEINWESQFLNILALYKSILERKC